MLQIGERRSTAPSGQVKMSFSMTCIPLLNTRKGHHVLELWLVIGQSFNWPLNEASRILPSLPVIQLCQIKVTDWFSASLQSEITLSQQCLSHPLYLMSSFPKLPALHLAADWTRSVLNCIFYFFEHCMGVCDIVRFSFLQNLLHVNKKKSKCPSSSILHIMPNLLFGSHLTPQIHSKH